MTDEQIKHMVNRFLAWKLPEDFSPDAGISFKPTFNEGTAHPMRHEPSGTNLFDARQAEAMVRHMLDAQPRAFQQAGVDAGRHHFGDPCIYCHTPHDEVAPGPCRAEGVFLSRERAEGLLTYLNNAYKPGWPTPLWVEVKAFKDAILAALKPVEG